MSKLNKVNPDHYKMAGRLSPDDLARERVRQGVPHPDRGKRRRKPMPPWMANEQGSGGGQHAAGAEVPSDAAASEAAEPVEPAEAAEPEVSAEDTKPRAPRRKVPRRSPRRAKRSAKKAVSARGKAKTRKAPATRAKGAGVTRRKQKKKRS